MTVTEAAGSDQPIVRVSTAVTGFVGRALRGPLNRPVRVRSFAEYQQEFGGLWQPSMLSYAVEQFFENGGREAVVVRVVNGTCSIRPMWKSRARYSSRACSSRPHSSGVMAMRCARAQASPPAVETAGQPAPIGNS